MFKRLKRAIKGINQKQNGQVFILVLIVLALGGIILAPTLNYTATSLKHQQVHETKTLELYSADSGVTAAIYAFSKGKDAVDSYMLNGKNVTVTTSDLLGDGRNYLITSTATSPDGSSTTIHAGVNSSAGFDFLLDNAITSYWNVDIKGFVDGDILAGGTISCDNQECEETDISGNITQDYEFSSWPPYLYLANYYAANVTMDNLYGNQIDVATDLTNTPYLESLYQDGELLIQSSDANLAYNVTLEGTIYVTDELTIGGAKDFILDLNGHTIFCEAGITISGKCRIIGSGCIIARYDINFGPNGDVGSEDSFVFLFSIEGTTKLNPSGNFYGSIAGNIEVVQLPGSDATIIWNSIGSDGGVDFPIEAGVLGSYTEDIVIGGWGIS